VCVRGAVVLCIMNALNQISPCRGQEENTCKKRKEMNVTEEGPCTFSTGVWEENAYFPFWKICFVF
jgi:hypothetical protein